MVLDGIYTGIPRRMNRPVADGIVCGLKKEMNPSIQPFTHKVMPSATQVSVGVFGAGASPQGQGDAKSGAKGMKMAHNAQGAMKKRKAMMAEAHEALHNM